MLTRIKTTEFIINSLNSKGIAIIDYSLSIFTEERYKYIEDEEYFERRIIELKKQNETIELYWKNKEDIIYPMSEALLTHEDRIEIDKLRETNPQDLIKICKNAIAFYGKILIIEKK